MESLNLLIDGFRSGDLSGIPMDIASHIFVGALVVLAFKVSNCRTCVALLMLLALAAGKEIYDYTQIGPYLTMSETFSDIGYSVVGGGFALAYCPTVAPMELDGVGELVVTSEAKSKIVLTSKPESDKKAVSIMNALDMPIQEFRDRAFLDRLIG